MARARCRSTCAAAAYASTTSCTALFVTAPCNVRITMMIMILIIMIMMMIIMIMMMIIMVLIVKGDVPCGCCCRRWKIENEPWTWNIACKEFDHILIKTLFLTLDISFFYKHFHSVACRLFFLRGFDLNSGLLPSGLCGGTRALSSAALFLLSSIRR